jgi:hypothetical protein
MHPCVGPFPLEALRLYVETEAMAARLRGNHGSDREDP